MQNDNLSSNMFTYNPWVRKIKCLNGLFTFFIQEYGKEIMYSKITFANTPYDD